MQFGRHAAAAAFLLLMALLWSSASEAAPLPQSSLNLSCRGSVSPEELRSFTDFIEFAEQHDGEPVFVSISIEANSGAGGCPRNDASEESGMTFRSCANVSDNFLCNRRDKVLIQAFGQGLPYTHGVILPGERTLPLSLPYRYYEYGAWMSYSGPFIVRYFTGTGFAYATLDVPDPALDNVWLRANENTAVRPREAD